jgi:hypothetical protein
MAILTVGHICLVFISPPGELTIMVYFMMVMGRLCFATNFDDMKECDTLKANKIIEGCEFAKNIMPWLPGGTILSPVAWQSTLETCNKSLTSLRGGILLVQGCRTRYLLYIMPWLLHNSTNSLLLGMEHWISRTLHLKVGMLHQKPETLVLKLRTWDLYRCMTQKWGSDKLTGL